jgi:hypothetical protein
LVALHKISDKLLIPADKDSFTKKFAGDECFDRGYWLTFNVLADQAEVID